jgi:hypothetical protein
LPTAGRGVRPSGEEADVELGQREF